VKHDETEKSLLRLLDGELPAAQAAAARRHLADCPDCARKLAVLEQAWKAAREAGRVEPPPFLHARIAARIREYERNRHFLSDLMELVGRVAQRAVLVVLVAGAVGLGIYLGGTPATPLGTPAQGGPSYLDIFDDLPPQSVGGVYATLAGTAK
jgi:anti-sigma factor RsiW